MLDPKPYILPFLLAFLFSLILTPAIRKIALKFDFVDRPAKRKVHKKPTARMGGVSIFVSFILVAVIFYFARPYFFTFAPWQDYNLFLKFFGVFLGALILVIVGLVDDKKTLSPWIKLIFQILAALCVILAGTRVEYINNPFGGFINFGQLSFNFDLFDVNFSIIPIADLVTLIWIVGMINVVNFLDGLDGLAAGVSFFGAISIFFISLLLTVYQPATAFLAIILAGAVLGFIPYNFNPAKIFMGDSGSQFLGYILAILAVISGAKLATAFLVLGFPILDGLWVVTRRIIRGTSPFRADRSHLHHRLLDFGFSVRQAVIFLWMISLIFGLIGIISTTYGKMLSGMILILVMILLLITLTFFGKRKNEKKIG